MSEEWKNDLDSKLPPDPEFQRLKAARDRAVEAYWAYRQVLADAGHQIDFFNAISPLDGWAINDPSARDNYLKLRDLRDQALRELEDYKALNL